MKTVKRILCMLVVIVVFALMTCSVVFATDSSPGDLQEPNQYVTWEFLGTMSGAVAATTLIVQFLKIPIDSIWKIKTRYIVYLIAFIILLSVEYVSQGGIIFERVALLAMNAVLVAMAAMGTYEATFKYLDKPS